MNNPVMKSDEEWMQRAIELARQAEAAGEVPVGAILVKNKTGTDLSLSPGSEILGEGFNSSIMSHDPSAHAEIIALRNAGDALKNYRLPGCTLYVTLEPCCMCAGAIIQARVERLVYAAADPNVGAAGSVFDLLNSDHLNHKVDVTGGVLEQEAASLLTEFFKSRR